MWTIDAPASRALRTSFAYSSGVYGMAAHCSLLATAPETAQVTMQLSESVTFVQPPVGADRDGAYRDPSVSTAASTSSLEGVSATSWFRCAYRTTPSRSITNVPGICHTSSPSLTLVRAPCRHACNPLVTVRVEYRSRNPP